MDAELWGVTGGVETEREEGIWKALGSQLLSSRSQLSPQGARGNICSEDLSQQTDPLLLEGRPQHGVLEAGEPKIRVSIGVRALFLARRGLPLTESLLCPLPQVAFWTHCFWSV